MPTTQVISYCVYVRREERGTIKETLEASYDAWFPLIYHRLTRCDRTQVEERGGCHQEIGGILFSASIRINLMDMRNAIKLIPIFSLAALLSYFPESNAASPTEKVSQSPDVQNATAANAKSALSPDIQQLIEKGFVIFIPKGTRVPVVFDTNLSSDKSRPGDEFSLSTGQDILLEKTVLVPKGTVIKGTVLDGQALIPPSAKLVAMQLRFESLNSPTFGKINTAGGKLIVKGDEVAFVRGGKKLFLHSLFVTTPYRPPPPPDCNAFKTDKGKKIEIATGDKFDFEFSSDVRVSPP